MNRNLGCNNFANSSYRLGMTQAQIISCSSHIPEGRSRVRVGDIFDISVKDTVEIQGLIE